LIFFVPFFYQEKKGSPSGKTKSSINLQTRNEVKPLFQKDKSKYLQLFRLILDPSLHALNREPFRLNHIKQKGKTY